MTILKTTLHQILYFHIINFISSTCIIPFVSYIKLIFFIILFFISLFLFTKNSETLKMRQRRREGWSWKRNDLKGTLMHLILYPTLDNTPTKVDEEGRYKVWRKQLTQAFHFHRLCCWYDIHAVASSFKTRVAIFSPLLMPSYLSRHFIPLALLLPPIPLTTLFLIIMCRALERSLHGLRHLKVDRSRGQVPGPSVPGF